jgi:hypothetical protein
VARADQAEVRARIVIERPVAGVLHSLQEGDDKPLDPKRSAGGEALAFDFPLRIERTADGAKFFGPQVRREGKERRFVYIRVGTAAGDRASPWSRRMKVDIHDIDRSCSTRRSRAGCSRRRSTGPPGRQPGVRDDPAGGLAGGLSPVAMAAIDPLPNPVVRLRKALAHMGADRRWELLTIPFLTPSNF